MICTLLRTARPTRACPRWIMFCQLTGCSVVCRLSLCVCQPSFSRKHCDSLMSGPSWRASFSLVLTWSSVQLGRWARSLPETIATPCDGQDCCDALCSTRLYTCDDFGNSCTCLIHDKSFGLGSTDGSCLCLIHKLKVLGPSRDAVRGADCCCPPF